MKKILFIFLFFLVSFLGTHFVHAYIADQASVEIIQDFNPEMIYKDKVLKNDLILVKSSQFIVPKKIISTCDIQQKIVFQKQEKNSVYTLFLFQPKEFCSQFWIHIADDEKKYSARIFKKMSLDTISWKRKILDLPTFHVNKILTTLEKNIQIKNKFSRIYLESLQEQKDWIDTVVSGRKNIQYHSPIFSMETPTYYSYIPNASRGYRSTVTDGIHHSWDFYTHFRTPVSAVEKGLIIRIQNGFSWENFNRIKQGNTITEDDKAWNLDIYRGNQVWLQTLDGNVFMYNHLDTIPDHLAVGDVVLRWETLGNIGVSGIPERGYSNYHLDISLSINPYNSYYAGKYSFLDIMKWDWFGKWQTQEWVLENQKGLFIGN